MPGAHCVAEQSKVSHRDWFQWWGRCAYTDELVKPADLGDRGGHHGEERHSSREQHEPWLWIKEPVSLSTAGLTLAGLHTWLLHLLIIDS